MNWVPQIQIAPEGSYCLRRAQRETSKKDGKGFVCHADTAAESIVQATQLSYLPLKCTGKYWSGCSLSVRKEKKRKERCFTSACTFFTPPPLFLYICIYLCFYYKIARIKLLASLPSFRDARVKAASVKKINYLYRCGIEASSKL